MGPIFVIFLHMNKVSSPALLVVLVTNRMHVVLTNVTHHDYDDDHHDDLWGTPIYSLSPWETDLVETTFTFTGGFSPRLVHICNYLLSLGNSHFQGFWIMPNFDNLFFFSKMFTVFNLLFVSVSNSWDPPQSRLCSGEPDMQSIAICSTHFCCIFARGLWHRCH